MGDSLSAAYNMPLQKGWVYLLSQKPEMKDIKVVNGSISGETSSGGKQRLTKLLETHQPKWMILELGINDAFRGQNLKSTQKNLQHMIDACLERACKVLLLGNKLPTNYGPAYDAVFRKMYRQLASNNPVLFDPFFLTEIVVDAKLLQRDGLHPTAPAQPMVVERLWPNIQKLMENSEE